MKWSDYRHSEITAYVCAVAGPKYVFRWVADSTSMRLYCVLAGLDYRYYKAWRKEIRNG